MEAGGGEGARGTDRRTWQGYTDAGQVLFGAPVPGGTRGDCPCGGTRVHPPTPGLGSFSPKWWFFSPIRGERLG